MKLYRNAGIAIATTQRLAALLAEAAYRAEYLASSFRLVHAGAHTSEKEALLVSALRDAGLPDETPIHWAQGSPDEAIIRTIRQQHLDLLLAGAVERERTFRYFMGSVAHDLVRAAPCSLLLLTDATTEPAPLKQIAVVTDYSEGALIALTKAVRFAENEGAERVFVVRALSQYGQAMLMTEGVRREQAATYQAVALQEEKVLLQDFIDAVGLANVPVEPHFVEGHPGPALAQFVREHRVDLLAMPSSSGFGHFFERLFPSEMEWLLRELPCNLWVVRDEPSLL